MSPFNPNNSFDCFSSDPILIDDHDIGSDDRNPNGEMVKKKRRSVNEKFLEDNSEYYGFQVLSSKLRSSGEVLANHSSSSSSFQKVLALLHDRDQEEKVGH